MTPFIRRGHDREPQAHLQALLTKLENLVQTARSVSSIVRLPNLFYLVLTHPRRERIA